MALICLVEMVLNAPIKRPNGLRLGSSVDAFPVDAVPMGVVSVDAFPVDAFPVDVVSVDAFPVGAIRESPLLPSVTLPRPLVVMTIIPCK